jgi:Leucine-rich repeat (LRR) protein
MENYYIDEYAGDQALIVRKWDNQCEEILRKNKLDFVVLNQARGWTPVNIDFLAGVSVKKLQIIAYSPLKGLEKLNKIQDLAWLSLECEAKNAVDLSNLKIEECWFNWSENLNSILAIKTLKRCRVSYWPFKDLSTLSSLEKLEELKITEGKLRSLNGIGIWGNSLKKLDLIYLKQLNSLEGIELFVNLEDLSLEGCKKIEDLTLVGELKKLKSLNFSDIGEVRSVAPISSIKSLKKLDFGGNTNIIDGDLSCLSSLKDLQKVLFEPRKHYSHSSIMGLTRPIRKFWR